MLACDSGAASSDAESQVTRCALADLLKSGAKVEPIVGYKEVYNNRDAEGVFAKDSFSFAPDSSYWETRPL
jgi:hypothetical protein